jgi:type I restriction enzyme R subunit
LGRETKSEVVLTERLRKELIRLNPDVSSEAIEQTIEELIRDRSRMSMVAANREIYNMLRNGTRITIPDDEYGEDKVENIRIIDWEEPYNNDFLLCSQLWVTGEMYTRRADLVGFVNGIPLVFIELKAFYKRLESAFSGNFQDYKDTIPQLFWYNALVILSNGSQSKVGSITSGWEHFGEWKKVESEEEPKRVSIETMLRGVCEPSKLLDIVENFTLFKEAAGGLVKIIPKNHQYLGVNNAIKAISNIKDNEGKLGVFWHTQGSGKSVSMMFFSQKVLRKIPGNWTFLIVTDRHELDDQIYKQFVKCGLVYEDKMQADSSKELRQYLREDHRYIFTLIHKFRTEKGEKHPVLSKRENIIVITDEAHRTQYDLLALNMRTALPNASFLAFTGTPLMVGEEKTKQVFGDYISIYDFQQSIEDGATVPLYYENRIPELQITNENFNEEIERILEEAELDEAQEEKLQREFSKEYYLITREERLETIAKDLVEHFVSRGFKGKAMMVCVDKATAIKMYNKVQKYWRIKIEELEGQQLREEDNDRRKEIKEVISFMKKTDMAVVVSQGQNEISKMAEKGLDIKPHRKRMIEEDLDEKFKDPENPLRLVFVCAMWMTGFDVPICSTLYLDKPMRNHTLMQTIARANRVYPGKACGLIVDYVGVFRNLEKALAIYAIGNGEKKPVEDKKVLIEALEGTLAEVRELCNKNGVNLDEIIGSRELKRLGLIDDTVEALITSENTKRRYLDLVNAVNRLYKGVLPDKEANQFVEEIKAISYIADKIRSLTPPADISDVMQQVEILLDESVASQGYIIGRDKKETNGKDRWIDLSDIDFEELAKKFDKKHKRTLNEKLKASVSRKVVVMVKFRK